MIPAANLLAFGLASIPLIVIPGPSVLFTIGRSLSLGRVGGLLSVVGNAAGALVISIAIAFGLGSLLEESVVAFTIVKFAGAAYIIFLGIQAIRHRRQKADAVTAPVARRGAWRTVWEGFVVGVTNAKSIIFMVAVLPLFVDHTAGGIPLQILLLGVVFVIVALVSDSAWALAAGAARDWFARSPKRIATLSATGGAMMIGLGAAVLFVNHEPA
ncbi:threonine/homoserine/homoserine lactone efflux protein [Cryobacterium mesophilum]|uniref:LysE family translocator n=1 Tax=Terrimesophilobacter mesophilus TaxID=433647 RepID=A0A4R8VCZ3_9MICO|nr:LysE family translocator [Terrimesophilobacter mesophilus]MBB5633916.1 threonine/homoserine/homoserine lactone efflux protein [Terrimesophilobacter mesophilus]TFB80585.1 LysE family translocator [Terrimesophilobacter mesophilus]